MTKLDIIAGARPNFMKIAPIIHAIHRHNNRSPDHPITYRLIHTGQHYDKKMSEDFFIQLNIPQPDINLGVGSNTQAIQTANIMIQYEEAIRKQKPEWCIVVGDVTSTMACAIVAKKEQVKVAHVEGGIRSFDITMPEEINRIVTDSISDCFFTTSVLANENLRQMGQDIAKIHFVGNTMIDSLYSNLDRFRAPELYESHHLTPKSYIVMTLHRPSNVDSPENLTSLLQVIDQNTHGKKVIFPMHPRTRKIYENLDLNLNQLIISEPLPYLEFMFLVKNALGVITDSGGITEETTVLGVPCMTLRDSTERPETVTIGTNEIVGTNPSNIIPYLHRLLRQEWKQGSIPTLWDGKTADRIVEILIGF